jgi:hypothetical protein
MRDFCVMQCTKVWACSGSKLKTDVTRSSTDYREESAVANMLVYSFLGKIVVVAPGLLLWTPDSLVRR